jgi:antirestriction protein ArdC
MATSTTTKQNGYERVAEQIIAALDAGTAPWRKPWLSTGYAALSLSTKKEYKGINQMLLTMTAGMAGYDSPWWGTYKQITENGGQIRKGEKGSYVVYFNMIRKEDAEGNEKTIPLLKGFTVFNAQQADWEEGKEPVFETQVARSEVDANEAAEAIIAGYLATNGPTLEIGGDKACYIPASDIVRMPQADKFLNSAGYYSTMFHELGHSTGAANRLNRPTVVECAPFGSENYGREELVAEFTAAFLCSATGILPGVVENSAAYIANWKQAIKDDPKCVVWAAGRAQKAADLIQGITAEVENTTEAVEEAA